MSIKVFFFFGLDIFKRLVLYSIVYNLVLIFLGIESKVLEIFFIWFLKLYYIKFMKLLNYFVVINDLIVMFDYLYKFYCMIVCLLFKIYILYRKILL